MESYLKAFVAYFVVVDPVGAAMVFNALTGGASRRHRAIMAGRSAVLSTATVLAFGLWGVDLLNILGIQMDSFRIAGGLLIFHAAFGMITRADGAGLSDQESYFEDISVYPLTIPLLAGPGCLTLTVLLFSRVPEGRSSFLPLVLAILTVFALTFVSFLLSRTLVRLVGQTINSMFKRLLGVVLASLAIQFVTDGIKGLWG